MMDPPAEKLTSFGQVNHHNQSNVMGDKSPKANLKKSTQKQSKTNSASLKKKQAITAKQVAGKQK